MTKAVSEWHWIPKGKAQVRAWRKQQQKAAELDLGQLAAPKQQEEEPKPSKPPRKPSRASSTKQGKA